MDIPFDMCVGQDVGIILLPLVGIALCGMEERISLVGVFCSKSCDNLPFACAEYQFAISGPDALCSIVVHGVGEAVILQSERNLVVVVPILILKLVVG